MAMQEIIFTCNWCGGTKRRNGDVCDGCGGSGKRKRCYRGECQEHGCSGYRDCYVPVESSSKPLRDLVIKLTKVASSLKRF